MERDYSLAAAKSAKPYLLVQSHVRSMSGVKESQAQKVSASSSKSATTTSFSLDEISQLIEMLERHEVTEFEIERGEEKLKLKRGSLTQTFIQTAAPIASVAPAAVLSAPAAAPVVSPSIGSAAENGRAENGVASSSSSSAHEIKSPMVGTFYRRPAPDAKPFVDVGSVVKKGDVLCIVEAMKLMNEIEADMSGKIVEVRLDDGQMVEYGEVLFRIDPRAS